MKKICLLLHFYNGQTFLGQTLAEVEAKDTLDLQRMVLGVYPGTRSNLYGLPSGAPSKEVPLPALVEGYGPGTVVKVMQILPLTPERRFIEC